MPLQEGRADEEELLVLHRPRQQILRRAAMRRVLHLRHEEQGHVDLFPQECALEDCSRQRSQVQGGGRQQGHVHPVRGLDHTTLLYIYGKRYEARYEFQRCSVPPSPTGKG